MTDCCSDAACEVEKLRERLRATLLIVLAVNGVMFLIEIGAGLIASSTALLMCCAITFPDTGLAAGSSVRVWRSM